MAEGRGAIWAAVAGSIATLVCCALPALLVLAGFGTAVAGVLSAAPWLVTLSRHKGWVFVTAAVLIMSSRFYAEHVAPRFVPPGAACPPALSRATRMAWWVSVVVYAAGLFVAYALGPLLALTDR
ncbi:MAG: hypothetical protein L0271_01170 [Gemmatimonadetes bacterium]|nr:hypothetical protein [Gemmatimonadota bacterium]